MTPLPLLSLLWWITGPLSRSKKLWWKYWWKLSCHLAPVCQIYPEDIFPSHSLFLCILGGPVPLVSNIRSKFTGSAPGIYLWPANPSCYVVICKLLYSPLPTHSKFQRIVGGPSLLWRKKYGRKYGKTSPGIYLRHAISNCKGPLLGYHIQDIQCEIPLR